MACQPRDFAATVTQYCCAVYISYGDRFLQFCGLQQTYFVRSIARLWTRALENTKRKTALQRILEPE